MDSVRASYYSGLSDLQTQSQCQGQEGQMTFDEALQQVGASHYYQKRAFVYFGMQWLFANWILMSPIYIFKNPEVYCSDDACKDACPNLDSFPSQNKCSAYICEQSVQTQLIILQGESLMLAFNEPLICEKQGVADILRGMPYSGSLVGFFIFSFIADNYGRRLGIGASWFCASIGALVLGFSQNYEMVAIGMFLTGFGVNPAITIQYSIINEHTIGSFRDIQNIGVQIFFGVGEMLIVVIAYFFPSWRTLTLFWFSIPLVLMNFGIFLFYESPKFLYQKNKYQAVKVLNQIAVLNGRQEIQANQLETCRNNQQHSSRVYSIIDLVKYRSLRVLFLCGLLIFYSIQAVYYGISFAMDGIGLNLYINCFIIGFFETLAFSVADHLIVNLRRKKTILIGFLTSCILSFGFVFLKPPNNCGDICAVKIIQIISAGFIRFVICFIMATTYTYLSELFPTVVRSLAVGLISGAGTVGSITCPFVVTFANHLGISPLIPLGVIGLLGAASVIPLKETLGQPLTDDIDEDQVIYFY